MEKRYPDLRSLLCASDLAFEYDDTRPLIAELAGVRERGFFTYDEFFKVCCWKEKRQRKRRYWQANTDDEVRALSRRVFATDDEDERMELLDSLKGVGIPVASAILTLTDPARYGVIDLRVWQVLYMYGEVSHTPKGVGLGPAHWREYLPILRRYAADLGVTARGVERALFAHHREVHKRRLYA
jgi:hypothetical protein